MFPTSDVRVRVPMPGDPFTRIVAAQDTSRFEIDTTGEVVHVGVRLQPDSHTGNMRVVYVAPGSSADLRGVLEGDQILKVNDLPAISLTKG